MAHPPSAICASCNVPMVTQKTGVGLECLAAWGSYFKVRADRLECPSCGCQVYCGFGFPTEHHHPEYSAVTTDVQVALE